MRNREGGSKTGLRPGFEVGDRQIAWLRADGVSKSRISPQRSGTRGARVREEFLPFPLTFDLPCPLDFFPSTLPSSSVRADDSMAALAPVHRVTAPLDDVLKDQAALQEWEEFCDRYSQGQFDHTGIPSPPTVIQAILNNTPTRPPLRPLRGDTTNLQNAARPAYADNQYGRPETVSQLLEFYRNHHHFPAPVDANEVRRAAMIRRFGLDRRDLARESCIDESEAVRPFSWRC